MRTRRNALIATAAIAIFAALLVWRYRAPVATPSARQTVTANTPEPVASNTPVARPRPEPRKGSKPEIPDDRPFAEIRPELEHRALAGDAAAARRLGLTLANCNQYVDIPDEQAESVVVEEAAKGINVRNNGRVMQPEEVLGLYKILLKQKRHDCKGVSGLNEDDAWKKAFQWIERAAALGDADAEAVYGSFAFADIETRNALADAETMRDRRQLTIDYLQQSLEQGDGLALLRMSSYYGGSYFYPANPETAYAYLYGYSLTTRANEVVPELLDQMLSSRAAPLDETARERARAEGQRLASCCGIVAQEGP